MEFIISSKPEKKNDMWHIIGRCSSAVFRGGRFTKCIPYKVSRNDKNEAITTYGIEHPIDLVVEKIIAYKNEFDILDPGMTALLVLSGDASEVIDQTVLRS